MYHDVMVLSIEPPVLGLPGRHRWRRDIVAVVYCLLLLIWFVLELPVLFCWISVVGFV
jgi:hypothetical protein